MALIPDKEMSIKQSVKKGRSVVALLQGRETLREAQGAKEEVGEGKLRRRRKRGITG